MLRDRPRWWIGKDSLGIGKDSLGIVYDVTHCYNLGEKCILIRYRFPNERLSTSIGLPRLAR